MKILIILLAFLKWYIYNRGPYLYPQPKRESSLGPAYSFYLGLILTSYRPNPGIN